MTPTQLQKIQKFCVSLLWNLGGMIVAFTLDAFAKNLGLFLPTFMPSEATVIFFGILLSRITKVVNVYFQEKAIENEI